ncbi:Acyl carrier protein 2, mitochondrial [Hordeum vulgare]|nr:Acyl carrier protein 2, mitochondrial [Hordeum vulgare]
MSEGMLHIRDVEGPKKIGSMETRLEAMEQQVFKCQGMMERGLNANHMMITEFTSKHKMDAIDIGKHLSRLYDRVDQLQGQIYDLQNQNLCHLDEADKGSFSDPGIAKEHGFGSIGQEWHPPNQGVIKMNTDGAIRFDQNCSMADGVARLALVCSVLGAKPIWVSHTHLCGQGLLGEWIQRIGDDAHGHELPGENRINRRFNMTQNRAKWIARYEKGLVEILTEYNLSHYRGQNRWTTEGWNQVVKELNNLYPHARFTKDQVQDKEAQLKKHYKNIKSIVNRSGISWNDVACVINTTPEKWEEIIAEDSKLKMYEGKSFPLYEALGVLYEGHITQGRHCLTSRKPPTITKSGSNFGAKEKMVASSSKRNTRDRSDDSMRTPLIIDINDIPAWDDVDGDAERENTVRDEEEFGSDADGDHPQISESSAKGRRPKKQKSATSVQRLEDSMMAYVNFKKEQATKKERVSQQGKQPSITECLEILNDMEDVPDEVKIFASDVFKDAANREIFLGYNSRLRGMWLKKEVDKISPQPPPFYCIGMSSVEIVMAFEEEFSFEIPDNEAEKIDSIKSAVDFIASHPQAK